MIEIFWGKGKSTEGKEKENLSLACIDCLPVADRITMRGNIISFNGIVDTISVNRLIDLSRTVMSQTGPAGAKPEYYLYMNSYGGYVSEMFRFVDFFESEVIPSTSKQVSVVHGISASAASFIAAAFPERWITTRSTIMIHELLSWIGGPFTFMATEMKHLADDMEMIVSLYARVMKVPETEIRALLLKNSWFNAKEALAMGLATKII